jgi:ADP-ribose pyrophosphatase YjhB (NUDIX family)
MSRVAIPTWTFVVMVVRRGTEFLLVHERKHGQRWYLPAGRVELGESFEEAAHREAREEAGVSIVLDGILRIEHTPRAEDARMRVFYVAHTADHRRPKSEPDEESLEARWFTLPEIAKLNLRGLEVLRLLRDVEAGAPLVSMSLIQPEL